MKKCAFDDALGELRFRGWHIDHPDRAASLRKTGTGVLGVAGCYIAYG
jgi:hypothetical protein